MVQSLAPLHRSVQKALHMLALRRPPENRSARVVQADQYKCVYGNKPKNPNPSIERTSSCLRLPSLPHVVTKLL